MNRRSWIALMSLGALHGQNGRAPSMRIYNNGRFGFSVSYPEVLIPQGEAVNGDGQIFVSKDKSFEMAAWAGFNALEHTVAAECEWNIEVEKKRNPLKVTYQVVKAEWYVFSGLAGSNIVYQKGIRKGDVFTKLRLAYPVADKEKWDATVKAIVASLAAGAGIG